MFDPLFKDIAENPLLFVPAAAVLLFAGVLHLLLRREGAAARRRALLFGVGIVALLASIVFAAFAWSLLRLLVRGAWSFDPVWIGGALWSGPLSDWRWLGISWLVRQR